MSRFFVPGEFIKGNTISISGKEAHHILDVMRLKVSDEVVVFDGTGKEYTGIVKVSGRKSLEVEVRTVREVLLQTRRIVTLIQAIPKKDKMDYITEKATELGVSGIIPVITERTIPEWSDSKKMNVVERWRKIALEAAKQCGRADVPEIGPIKNFIDCFGPLGLAMTSCDYDLKLIAALSDKAIKPKNALKDNNGKNIAIAIGPEGDFTLEETEMAVKAGYKIVSLGPRVLKSDTAGLAALSIINYEYED